MRRCGRVCPMGVADRFARIGSTAQNVLEVARFGGLETEEESAPFDVVERRRVSGLRRYSPGAADGPPILLVPPLMLSAEVYDVAAAASAVRILHAHGADPWVVDF